MSTGLNIFKSTGALAYSTDEVTWNQAGVIYCPAGGNVSEIFDVIAGKETLTVQVPINPPSLTQRTYAHTVAISGTTVNVSGGNTAVYVLVLMR